MGARNCCQRGHGAGHRCRVLSLVILVTFGVFGCISPHFTCLRVCLLILYGLGSRNDARCCVCVFLCFWFTRCFLRGERERELRLPAAYLYRLRASFGRSGVDWLLVFRLYFSLVSFCDGGDGERIGYGVWVRSIFFHLFSSSTYYLHASIVFARTFFAAHRGQ